MTEVRPWSCGDVREAAAELAIDDLTGSERGAAIAHLATCADCRGMVADLSVAADSVLLVAPPVEPPAGFESRVLSRLSPASNANRTRRWLLPAAAAVVAAVAGAVIGLAIGASGGDERRLPAAGVLVGRSGTPSGSVVIASGPDRMTCVFEDERFGGDYAVEIVLADGTVTELGTFHADGAPWTWTVELPVPAADVRTVRVLDGEGTMRVWAEIA